MVEEFPPLPPLVEVFWEDHYSIGDDWYEPGHSHPPCVLSAVGYLVDEDEMYYYVACTYELDSGKYSAGTAVLKNCVVRFKQYTKVRTIVDQTKKPSKTRSKEIKLSS